MRARKKKTLTMTGDLNLDRMNPNRRECNGLKCLIKDPTCITNSSETLIDVILTNKPYLPKQRGVIFPDISDHGLVYGFRKEKVHQLQGKIIIVRSIKNLDVEKLNILANSS